MRISSYTHCKSPISTASFATLNIPSHTSLASCHQTLNLPLLNLMLQPPLRDKDVDELPLGTCICTFADTRAFAYVGLKRRWVTVTLRGVSGLPAHSSRSTRSRDNESLRPHTQRSTEKSRCDGRSRNMRGVEELHVRTFELLQCLHGSPPLQRLAHALCRNQTSFRSEQGLTYKSFHSRKLAKS